MIVKILTRHSPSYEALIRYMLKGEAHKEVFTHNLRGTTVSEWTQEFAQNESWRTRFRSDQTYLYHEIISFSANEDQTVYTPLMLADIARKYIEFRGTQGVYVGAVHKDKDHVHIHFCTSGLEFRTGKSFRLSRSELQTLKMKLQQYHIDRYPELVESICQHGTGNPYLTDRTWQARNRAHRSTLKETITKKVHDSFQHASSKKEFLTLLRQAGLHHYESNGKVQGIVSEDGTKFRFSRLGITTEQLSRLAIDMVEEASVLALIRAMRQEREQDIDRY